MVWVTFHGSVPEGGKRCMECCDLVGCCVGGGVVSITSSCSSCCGVVGSPSVVGVGTFDAFTFHGSVPEGGKRCMECCVLEEVVGVPFCIEGNSFCFIAYDGSRRRPRGNEVGTVWVVCAVDSGTGSLDCWVGWISLALVEALGRKD